MTQSLRFILPLILVATPACTQPAPTPEAPPVSDAAWLLICSDIGEIAHSIMHARQLGAPMSEVLSLGGDDAMLAPAFQAIAQAAYVRPRRHTEEDQLRAIQDFRTDMERMCSDL